MATRKIRRLERILQCYEDTYWFEQLQMEARGSNVSLMPKASLLRRTLEMNEPADPVMDVLMQQVQKTGLHQHNIWKYLLDHAADVASWAQQSRRVFHVSEDLASMLVETDLPEFLPGQVKFVATAFVVTLEVPIFCPAEFQDHHDFFVFLSYETEDPDVQNAISIRSYDSGYESYQPLSASEKGEYRRLMMGGESSWGRVLRRFQQRLTGVNVTGFDYFCANNIPFNEILSLDDDEAEARKIFFQICFGLNLYLQSARRGDSEEHANISGRLPDGRQSLVTGVELFTLSVSESFKRPSESQGVRAGEVSPHFRRGYWRRPKGFGRDPDALATEWVRPTWVRQDKIKRGDQPIGSFQNTECK